MGLDSFGCVLFCVPLREWVSVAGCTLVDLVQFMLHADHMSGCLVAEWAFFVPAYAVGGCLLECCMMAVGMLWVGNGVTIAFCERIGASVWF